MGKTMHMALSVDIDRFTDAHLRKHYGGALVYKGSAAETPKEIRFLCRLARSKGFEVFPPCDNVDEKGCCKGHPEGPEE